MRTVRLLIVAVLICAGVCAGGAWLLVGRIDPFPNGDLALGAPIVARDGRTYRPGHAWWTTAIVRDDSSTGGAASTVVAEAGTDSPCRYVVFISPDCNQADRLVETADGVLVAVDCGTTYLAYDPKSGRTFSGEGIADISPFLLLGPGDQVPEQDVKALEAKAVAARSDRYQINWIAPSDDVLVKELASSNASVRAAARRLAAAGGEALYPNATKRLR